jgi:hypothetical protein
MNLFSMIPLNVDRDHPTPTRGSALDIRVSEFSGVMANFTRGLTTMMSSHDEPSARAVFLPPVFEHHRTPFKPAFRHEKHYSPDSNVVSTEAEESSLLRSITRKRLVKEN